MIHKRKRIGWIVTWIDPEGRSNWRVFPTERDAYEKAQGLYRDSVKAALGVYKFTEAGQIKESGAPPTKLKRRA